MRITVNRKLNVAYVHLRDRRADTVETEQLSDDLLLDVGSDGTVYGLELLNASEQLRDGDLAQLEVADEESGETTSVALPL
jgi:uncharacterized protein YuzE